MLAGGAAAGGLAAFWWSTRDEAGSLVDKVADAIVNLTTSDETRLSELQADTQANARLLIQELANQGIAVKVGSTLRTSAAEKAAIAAGRSSADLKISWHQIGRALDLYPIDPNTGQWDKKGARDDLFQQMHAIARSLGWRGIAYEADGTTRHYIQTVNGPTWDGGHLEWRAPYGSIAEAVAAEGAEYGLA